MWLIRIYRAGHFHTERSRNYFCGQVERFPIMVYHGSRNLVQSWKIAQTRKELDSEHEVQLVLHGSGHRTDKAAFFFCWVYNSLVV